MTLIVLGKAVFLPLALAVVLVMVLRRSANSWRTPAALGAGMLGAFSLNTSILRNLPSVLPPDQLVPATTHEAWMSAFVEAALPEEFAKGVWVLILLAGGRPSPGRGALFGGLVGLGFAAREDVSYSHVSGQWRVMADLSHCSWGVIMGYYFRSAIVHPSWRLKGLALGFLVPVLLHGLLDATIFLVDAQDAVAGTSDGEAEQHVDIDVPLLLTMASTFAIDLLSIIWCVRLVWRVRSGGPGEPHPEAASAARGQSPAAT